ncbi:MAG: hypothetical protein RR131_07570, partial [Anaerovorax sp.]
MYNILHLWYNNHHQAVIIRLEWRARISAFGLKRHMPDDAIKSKIVRASSLKVVYHMEVEFE